MCTDAGQCSGSNPESGSSAKLAQLPWDHPASTGKAKTQTHTRINAMV